MPANALEIAKLLDRALIVTRIEDELERATRDGISRETLPTAREGQLDGYIAGLQKALELASRA